MIIGAALMIGMWFVFVAQVLEWLPKSFAISLIAFSVSLSGFMIGMHGLAQVYRIKRRNRDEA